MNTNHVTTGQELADRLSRDYGVVTDGTTVGPEYHEQVDHDHAYTLREVADAKGRITRVRFLTERIPGQGYYFDVSYIHATLPNGKTVPVRPDFDSFLIPERKVTGVLIEWAKSEGVFAKGLGLLDRGNWSILR